MSTSSPTTNMIPNTPCSERSRSSPATRAPFDILYMIFIWATLVYTDTVPISPLDERIRAHREESLPAAITIGRVCKRWYNVISQLMPQFLSCGSSDDKVWESVSKRVGAKDDGAVGVGGRIKKLVLYCIDNSQKKLESALRIVVGCPNAQVISLSFPSPVLQTAFYFGIIEAIASSSGDKVLHLDIDFGQWFDEGIILSSMHNFKNLQILKIRDCFGASTGNNVVVRNGLDLRNLHTLRVTSCVEDRFNQLTSWLLSNLRHLHLFSIFDIEYAIPFFAKFGRQLESLEFGVPAPEIGDLLGMCHNLRDIVISLGSFTIHSPTAIYFQHNNVSRIGFRSARTYGLTFEDFKSTLKELGTCFIQKNFPKLSVIRFLELRQDEFLKYFEEDEIFWMDWLLALAEANITVENATGEALLSTIFTRDLEIW